MANEEQLKKLAQIFNTDRIISKDELAGVLEAIVGILANNKKSIDALTEESRNTLSRTLQNIADEHNSIVSQVDKVTRETKSSVESEVRSQLEAVQKRVEDLIDECKDIMPEDGKDADEAQIVADVLEKIKLPEYKEVVLDDGGEIVDKINALNVSPENQIDASHIKNLPEVTQRFGGGLSRATADTLYAPYGSTGTTTFVGLTDVPSAYTGASLKAVRVNAAETALEFFTLSGGGDALTANPLSQFAATTSLQLKGVISDETGSGALVFADSPTLVTPVLGVATATSINGATITSGTLNGSVTGTNTGDQTSIVGITGTMAQFDTAVTDGNIVYQGQALGTPSSGVATNLTGTASGLTAGTVTTNANLTGHITSVGNAAVLGSFTKAQLNTAVSDGDVVYLDSVDTITGVKTMTGLNVITHSSSGLIVRNPANTFSYTITGGAIAAARTLNLPVITGTDTVAVLGLAQTFTGTVTLTTPVLGTPSSGTLTNCTGLPIAGLTASTSTALGVGSIELGHASDTTLSRSAAGVLAVEGVVIPSISSTNTLTNKRVTKRVGTTTSSATPTINTDNVDMYTLTAQTVDITSFTTNLSGTPTDGQTLWIAITGTAARAITWGASFEASTVALPTTTVTTNRLDVGFVWNAATSKWRCVASA